MARRLHIYDSQWERTSASWKRLKPHRDFNKFFSESDELVADYCERLRPEVVVPLEVADHLLKNLICFPEILKIESGQLILEIRAESRISA